MWKASFTNATGDEVVLVKLKQQLANLSCRCKMCEKYNSTTIQDDNLAERKVKVTDDSSNKIIEMCHNYACPGCFVACNLLKNKNKTFKDEDTEADIVKFSLDKCVQKYTKGIERTTSMSLPLHHSNSSDFDNVSQNRNLKRKIEKVTFSNEKPKIKKPVVYANCLCLENFIDSIRPPLNY